MKKKKALICVLFCSIVATFFLLSCARCNAAQALELDISSVDLNNDGVINMADVMILAAKYNTNNTDYRFIARYDLNKDGAINMADVIVIAGYFNRKVSQEAEYIFDTGIIRKYNGTGENISIPLEINGVRVTTIGDGAFAGCSKLTNVIIPDSVTKIGDGAFAQCSSLNSITIPNSVTGIGGAAFSDCTNLKIVKIPNSVVSIGDCAFGRCGITNITIPDSVKSMGNIAFVNCPLSNAVFMGDQPSKWGDNVFVEVKEDFKIIVSPTATGFGKPAPYNGETSWNWSPDNKDIYKVVISGTNEDYIFDTGIIRKYNGTGENVSIPNEINGVRVTAIGDGAFAGCLNLKSVIIPDSVTKMGDGAFAQCTNLNSVTIPDSVTGIGGAAFSDCTNLKIVKIPDSVVSIGDSAFGRCGITNITIPDSVKSMGNIAFVNCPLSNAVFMGDQPSKWGDNVFVEAKEDFKIIVSPSAKGFGRPVPYNDETSWNWSPDNKDSYKVVISGTREDYIFDAAAGIIRKYNGTGGDVSIPDEINGVRVTVIGDGAFAGCSKLTSVIIPDSVTIIGDGAFAQCSNLNDVTIPDSVTGIGGAAFCDCTSLKNVIIPDSVVNIGNCAFGHCGITNIIIPISVKSIGNLAFIGCPLSYALFLGDQPSKWGDNVFVEAKEDFKILVSPNAKGFGRPAPYNNEVSWNWSPDNKDTYEVVFDYMVL